MDSNAPISFRAAQANAAYGMRPPQGPRSASSTTIPAGGRSETGRVEGGRVIPPFSPDQVARRDQFTHRPAELVAGTVDSPVSRGEGFDQPSAPLAGGRNAQVRVGPASPAASFAMYSRAADRIEVATAVSLGRALDARG